MLFRAHRDNPIPQRLSVLRHLQAVKSPRVLDIGGVTNPWAKEYTTHYFDHYSIHNPPLWCGTEHYTEVTQRAVSFTGNFNDFQYWKQIERDVATNGMFDFIICTHVLEHVLNPRQFLNKIENVGKMGFIAVPNKYTELRYGVQCGDDGLERCGLERHMRGFAPHRWIFTIVNGVLTAWPKLGFLEHMTGLDWVNDSSVENHELSFWWEGSIPLAEIKDHQIDFPDPQIAIDLYRNGLKEGL